MGQILQGAKNSLFIQFKHFSSSHGCELQNGIQKIKCDGLFFQFLSRIQVVIMRRRSGAIHTETEQQFLMLAEKALQKNGIFYDSKIYNELTRSSPEQRKQQQSTNKSDTNPFSEFDYDELKELEREERELASQLQKVQVLSLASLVVCRDVPSVARQLLRQPDPCCKGRTLDLVVKRLTRGGRNLIIKYWIISEDMLELTLSQIYLSSAAQIYWACEKECHMGAAILCAQDQLLQVIQERQNQYWGE